MTRPNGMFLNGITCIIALSVDAILKEKVLGYLPSVEKRKAPGSLSWSSGDSIQNFPLKRGWIYCAAGQGRVFQRVEIPPGKVSQPPGSKSLEAQWYIEF